LRRASIYQLGLPFFGLTPEYRINIFKQIHEIVFHGNGGYSWNDVYQMPIWLRRYTFNNIKEYYDEQAKNNKPKQQSTNKILKPGIAANYTSKASK
jgi:hypothetical protein